MDNTHSAQFGTNIMARIFYVAAFFNSLANGVTGPLFVVYLLSLHLSPIEIGILLGVERFTIIIFELPTGIFADQHGRRRSLLVSFGLSTIVLIGWFFSSTFLHALALSIFSGIAFTFQSGAKESLMIDTLRLAENDNARTSVFVRVGSWGNIGFVVGGVLAAGLSFITLRAIWLAAAICNAILFFIFALLVRNGHTLQVQEKAITIGRRLIMEIRQSITTGREAIRAVAVSGTLLSLFIVTMSFAFAVALYDLTYPIYLKSVLHMPNYLFALIASISALLGIASMRGGEVLSTHHSPQYALRTFALLLASAIWLLGIPLLASMALFIIIAIEILLHGWYPIFQSFFNKFIPSNARASVLSLQSVATLTVIGIGEFIGGIFITYISFLQIWMISGVLFAIIFLVLNKKWVAT